MGGSGHIAGEAHQGITEALNESDRILANGQHVDSEPVLQQSAPLRSRRSCTFVVRLKADAGEIILTGIRIREKVTVQRLLTRKFFS